MALASQFARTQFLEAAARTYAVTDPSTSAHLMLQRDVESIPQPRSTRQDLVSSSCTVCGTIFLPGWTLRTSLVNQRLNGNDVPKDKSSQTEDGEKDQEHEQKQQQQQRKPIFLVNECLICHRYVRTVLGRPRNPKDRKYAPIATIQRESISESADLSEMQKPAKINAQSKQRAKARKGGLQALLDKSTQSSAPPLCSFDLMDFMKQE